MINEIPINNVEEKNNDTLCIQQANQLGIHVRTKYKILFLRDFGHLPEKCLFWFFFTFYKFLFYFEILFTYKNLFHLKNTPSVKKKAPIIV